MLPRNIVRGQGIANASLHRGRDHEPAVRLAFGVKAGIPLIAGQYSPGPHFVCTAWGSAAIK